MDRKEKREHNKLVLEEANKTEVGRMQIKEIRKLKNTNKILSAFTASGMIMALYVDYLCFLSILNAFTGGNSSIILSIAAGIYATRIAKTKFVEGIEEDKAENQKLIDTLEDAILGKSTRGK